jgi:sRNA-binding regulator protein Hfq
MKDSLDTPIVRRSSDSEVFANRRLIRPSLSRTENHRPENGDRRDRGDRGERGERPAPNGKKVAPPEQTHAENFYYQKQMQGKTPMVIVLQDDEEIHGVIEWYDKYCLKVNRIGEPNVLIYKPSIKYMYKESEAGGEK